MTDLQLNPPKKERVFVMPATMNKYSFDKEQLLELGRGYEEQIEEIRAAMKENAKVGFNAANACLQDKLSSIEFQCKQIEKLLAK